MVSVVAVRSCLGPSLQRRDSSFCIVAACNICRRGFRGRLYGVHQLREGKCFAFVTEICTRFLPEKNINFSKCLSVSGGDGGSASCDQYQPSPDAALFLRYVRSRYIHKDALAANTKPRSMARGRQRSELCLDVSAFRSGSPHLFYVKHTAIRVADSAQTRLH